LPEDNGSEKAADADALKTSPIHRFIQCILLILVLPLLPTGLEWLLTSTVTSESITLVASMYAITIGVSSKYKTVLAFAIIVIILFTAAYGSLAKERADKLSTQKAATAVQHPDAAGDPPQGELTRRTQRQIALEAECGCSRFLL
jgi:hypothetical protein